MNLQKKNNQCGIVILAAGQGKRMRSPLPKVLHEICGKGLIFHTISNIHRVLPDANIAIVVGHGREQVEQAVQDDFMSNQRDLSRITFIYQKEQKGTGHALQCVMNSEWGKAQASSRNPILVLPGDLPLVTAQLIEMLVEPILPTQALKLLSTVLENPQGYGRIIRSPDGNQVQKIVEEKDASTEQKKIKEVATSIYLFQSTFLSEALPQLSNHNAQGEYYLTDLVEIAANSKRLIEVLKWEHPEDLRGVNDLWELSQAERILNQRTIRNWAIQGVRFIDPLNTYIDCDVQLSEQVEVHPGAVLKGKTQVAQGARIGSGSVLKNVQVGKDANIKVGTVAEESIIGEGAQLGPYAHLRPDSYVGKEAKIGNFVELKKTRIGEKTSVAHLSYLGDAQVGKNVNIGCGFVTCNFDGRVIDGKRKHETIIEDEVFLGSDCQTVAPVRIGRGAYVASGSTVTEDVAPGALAIARTRQVNKPDYAKKLK